MAFPPEFLDELRARLPLSGLIARRVKLQRKGRGEHSGLCPFHKEKTPSFTVSDDKGFFHCFGCGAHGDAIGFVMQSEGLSFVDAVERLAGEAGLDMPRERPEAKAEAARRKSLMELTEAATHWFESSLEASEGAPARDYLAGRGLTQETIRAFRLGFAPGQRGALRKQLEKEGFEKDQIAEAGLIKLPEEGAGEAIRDYFFDRIIFPITNRQGKVIAFGGRTMGESRAKYINSPETTLFHKGQVLYNQARARKAARDQGELVVAEGYMDVIALAQAGFQAAVAPLGTAVTEQQLEELWRLVPEPIFCLDGDAAGRRAALRAAERALPALKPGRSLQFAFLSEGEDPDSLIARQGAGAFREVLAHALPLVELLWRRELEGRDLSTPERRGALKRDLRRLAQRLGDSELAEDYKYELLRRYDLLTRPDSRRARPWSARQQGRGSHGSGNWMSKPRSQPLPDPSRQRLLRRRQLLLGLLIGHPQLLEAHLEEVAALDFAGSGLLPFRDALLSAVARFSADDGQSSESDESDAGKLDSAYLKCHLAEEGFGEVLKDLFSPQMMVHDSFLRSAASLEAAEKVYGELVEFDQGERARAEAEQALLQAMNESDAPGSSGGLGEARENEHRPGEDG